MRKATIVFSIISAGVAVSLWLLLASSSPQPPYVSVQFLGYTNVSPDHVGALFRVKNTGQTKVERSSQCYLACSVSSGAPSVEDIMSLRPVWKPGDHRSSDIGPGQTLLPQEEEIILVDSPPPDKPVWCVTFTVSRENTKWERRSYAAWETVHYWSWRIGLRHLVEEPQGLREVFSTISVREITNRPPHDP